MMHDLRMSIVNCTSENMLYIWPDVVDSLALPDIAKRGNGRGSSSCQLTVWMGGLTSLLQLHAHTVDTVDQHTEQQMMTLGFARQRQADDINTRLDNNNDTL